jgi:hypothetical protein
MSPSQLYMQQCQPNYDAVKSSSLHQFRPVNYLFNKANQVVTQLCHHRCTDVTHFFYSLSHYLCQINTDGYKQFYEPINILTRDPSSAWNVKHIVCWFYLVTQKFDVSVLNKADSGAIISRVKNWITSWVNYC